MAFVRFAPGDAPPSLVGEPLRCGFVPPRPGGGPDDSPPVPCFHPRQVHGAVIATPQPATAPGLAKAQRLEADGMATSGLEAIAIQTADCVPILLWQPADDGTGSQSGGRVMAIHAGWRGLAAGILARALEQLGNPRTVRAAIGPCIGQRRYEVGPEVGAAIAADWDAPEWRRALMPGEGDRSFLDCGRVAELQLRAGGVLPENGARMTSCTYDDERWASYRRQGVKAGRIWSWIQRLQA